MSDKLRRLKEEMILVYGLNCWMNELWNPNKKDILTKLFRCKIPQTIQ